MQPAEGGEVDGGLLRQTRRAVDGISPHLLPLLLQLPRHVVELLLQDLDGLAGLAAA